MSKHICFKHSIARSWEDVEREINLFNDKYIEVTNVTITPQEYGYVSISGLDLPKYIYHVCMTYWQKSAPEV